MLVTNLITKVCKPVLVVMVCQTKLTGKKISITGTQKSHVNSFRRLPPGPWSFPFLGVFYKIDSERPHLTYTEWNRKYGDVISFTLFGTQRAVVVSSDEAIRDVLINKQDHFSGIQSVQSLPTQDK